MLDNNAVNGAKEALEHGVAEAQEILNDPAKVEDVLAQAKARVSELPGAIGGALSNIPLMANMIKCYVTREYTAVSPKVVASVLGALVYLVKGKDLIPDNIPIVGLADDVAVITLAMMLNEPELKAFTEWQESHVILREENAVQADVVEAEATPVAEAVPVEDAKPVFFEEQADFGAPVVAEEPTAYAESIATGETIDNA